MSEKGRIRDSGAVCHKYFVGTPCIRDTWYSRQVLLATLLHARAVSHPVPPLDFPTTLAIEYRVARKHVDGNGRRVGKAG